MNTLVTGTFDAEKQAAEAVRKLVKSCVPMDLVRTMPRSRRQPARHRADGSHARGVTVAVKAPEYVAQRLAIKILRDHGAHNIECVNAQPRPKQRVRVRVAMRNPQTPVTA